MSKNVEISNYSSSGSQGNDVGTSDSSTYLNPIRDRLNLHFDKRMIYTPLLTRKPFQELE